jgi:hypothetical protein
MSCAAGAPAQTYPVKPVRMIVGFAPLRYTATMRTTARERAEAGVYPREFMGDPNDQVRVLSSPDVLHIIVCGDPHRNRLMVMEGGHTEPTTREVQMF